MNIAIINNAANYLVFNVNLAKYLAKKNITTTFLNCDLFISKQLKKHGFNVVNYEKINSSNSYYSKDSDIIVYYKRVFRIKNTNKLIADKNKEYHACLKHFKENSYDYVLILNGSFSVETDVCKELGIKCFFFEHGYFPNCIQMDSMGVNSSASFANLSLQDFYSFKYNTQKSSVIDDFKITAINYNIATRLFYRLLDRKYYRYLGNFLHKKNKQEKATKNFQSSKESDLDLNAIGKYIFFPLQVNSDTQIILNSQYNSMYDAIEKILPILKNTGYKIVIKEHPLEVEPVDYQKFIDNKDVFLVKKFNLNELIQNAEFVVNINSSVGLQSVALNKKVMVLGESFYKNSPTTIPYQDIKDKDVNSYINNLLINSEEVAKYVNHFKENIFIGGHFYTPNVNFLDKIYQRLV